LAAHEKVGPTRDGVDMFEGRVLPKVDVEPAQAEGGWAAVGDALVEMFEQG